MTSAAVDAAIERAVGWLQRAQRPDGLWNLPATTDHIGTIRQIAEYVITNRVVKRSQPEREARLLAQLVSLQDADGWCGNVDSAVLAYQALKLGGYDIDSAPLLRARSAILAAGGVVTCGLAARRCLATLGEFPWSGVPTVPIELVLLPPWTPFSLRRVAAAVRPAVLARMLQSAHRWSAHLSPEDGIQELWAAPPNPTAVAYPETAPPVSLRHLFVAGDRVARGIGYTPLVGLHRRAVARAIESLLQTQSGDGAWAGDARVTIDAVLALHAIGFTVDHPVLLRALAAVDGLMWSAEEQWTSSPRPDPVWQTVQAVAALRTAGLPTTAPSLTAATTALLTHLSPSGLAATNFAGAPLCVETTAMLVTALAEPSAASAAIDAAVAWAAARQTWNGGYATTDTQQTGAAWAQTVLADELSLVDAPTVVSTGRVLEAMAATGADRCLGRAWRAIDFLRQRCEPGRAWQGCVVQTAAALSGLAAIGEPLTAAPFAAAVTWLRAAQRSAGDWNAGAVASPAVATGNAVVALTTIAGPDDPAVRRGVDWLLAAQSREGGWMGGQQRADVCFEIVATTAPLAALGRYRGRRDAA